VACFCTKFLDSFFYRCLTGSRVAALVRYNISGEAINWSPGSVPCPWDPAGMSEFLEAEHLVVFTLSSRRSPLAVFSSFWEFLLRDALPCSSVVFMPGPTKRSGPLPSLSAEVAALACNTPFNPFSVLFGVISWRGQRYHVFLLWRSGSFTKQALSCSEEANLLSVLFQLSPFLFLYSFNRSLL